MKNRIEQLNKVAMFGKRDAENYEPLTRNK